MDLQEYLKKNPNITLVHFNAEDSDYTDWQNDSKIKWEINDAHPNGWWSVVTYPALRGLYQGTSFDDALKALEKRTYRKY